MTTAIEDNELDTELQELYLVNKQWLSDLQFLDTELEFLRKLAANNPVAVVRTEELNNLLDVKNSYNVLKKDISAWLVELEPLIVAKHKDFDFLLIEKYAQLKERLAEIFKLCVITKKRIFQSIQSYLSEHNIAEVVG
jgi:hypothetical protein